MIVSLQWLCIVLCISALFTFTHGTEDRDSDFSGHLQKFGSGRPRHSVETLDKFPTPKEFLQKYVLLSTPVKLAGVVKDSYPSRMWTDEYLLSIDIPEDQTMVLVETKKKENRKQPTLDMHFQEFVRKYHENDHYMVQPVPDFLTKDVTLADSLQCSEIYEDNIVDALMWFSSGGTKSVVHTDSVDNLNCLYHGDKEFVLVNPHKYGEKVDIDHPEGAYSSMDVDSVDYEKYPDMAEVEFLVTNLTAGDCLFIPYLWIHQVRSHKRNIAINLWWDHHSNENVNLEQCSVEEPDPTLTLAQVDFRGMEDKPLTIPAIKDHFFEMMRRGDVSFEKYYDFILGDLQMLESDRQSNVHLDLLNRIAGRLDKNKDRKMTQVEVKAATDEDWADIRDNLLELEGVMMQFEENFNNIDEQNENNDYNDGSMDGEEEYHDYELLDEPGIHNEL